MVGATRLRETNDAATVPLANDPASQTRAAHSRQNAGSEWPAAARLLPPRPCTPLPRKGRRV
eukprot:6194382-Pleurochrysis_carterae.AAC.2